MFDDKRFTNNYGSEIEDEVLKIEDELVDDKDDSFVFSEDDMKNDEVDDIKIGVVSNCINLNVRKEPIGNSAIVCEVLCLTELMIDLNESTDDFYKVFTTTGIEGFCMKKFVALQL